MRHPPIRTLIVDDEPLARAGMRTVLAGDPELVVVGECADGREAVEAIARERPDLVMLDIRMPELDGFEVVREAIRERGAAAMPAVVFITAHDDHALRAFEVDAVDYVTKPFEDRRLRAAVARAKRAVRAGALGEVVERLERVLERLGAADEMGTLDPLATGVGPSITRLTIRERGRVSFVPLDEIDWIEGADYYVRLHVGTRALLLRETLGALEARLDPAAFFRVHRSAIVRLDRVREIRPTARGDEGTVMLAGGASVPLARGRREPLEERLRRL